MSWVCAGMGTELGQPPGRVSPCPRRGGCSLSSPWLSLSLSPGAAGSSPVAASCFLAQLLFGRAAHQCQGLSPPSASLLGHPLGSSCPSCQPGPWRAAPLHTLLSLQTWGELGLISCRRLNCLFDRTNKIAAVLNGWFHMWNLIGMTDTSFHLHTHKKIRGLRLSSTNLFP